MICEGENRLVIGHGNKTKDTFSYRGVTIQSAQCVCECKRNTACVELWSETYIRGNELQYSRRR